MKAFPNRGTTFQAVAMAPTRRPARVSARAVVIGLALTPLNVLFLVHATWVVGAFTGGESLFANAVAGLFLLTLGNEGLKRARPTWALRPGELLTVYLLLAMGTGLTCGVWDFGGALTGTITYPYWFATTENRWREVLWPNFPGWLTVQDPQALEGFYLGRANPYTRAVLRAWAGPALWWACLVSLLLWVCLCLNSIVRRRWEDEEKLSFPLTVLPVHLVDEQQSPLRNRLFWLGAALAAGIVGWNTVASLVPALPAVPLGLDYRPYLRHPWWYIRYPLFDWGPWALGLCYLIPPDLAFSLLVFDLFWVGQYVGAGYLGWSTTQWGGMPYGDEQATGGLLAILISALWLDRSYLAQVLRRAVGRPSALATEEQEALSYRAAVAGAVAGVVLLCCLLTRAGMQAWLAPVFLVLYLMLALVMTRLRAQLGPPAHAFYRSMPNYILTSLLGTSVLGARTLGVFALMGPFLREQRSNPIPIQLEALKMAEDGRMERRRISIALMAVVPLAVLCYFWASLQLGYRHGMVTSEAHRWLSFVPDSFISEMSDAIQAPKGTDAAGSIAMGIGFAFTLLMMLLKLSFPGWPLHPVAYPLGISTSVENLTLAIFATWLTKVLLLRYGGLRAYRASLPFFLGLLSGGATSFLLQRLLYDLLGLRIGVLG